MKTLREQLNGVVDYQDYNDLLETAKQMDALLEECVKDIAGSVDDTGYGTRLLDKLKQAGYGNDADR